MDRSPNPENPSARRLLDALREARTRIETLELARSEPLAIVGAGCRFPGNAADLEGFWETLHRGADAITEVPKDRWDIDALYDPDPDVPGKMCTRYGGFLPDVDGFDAPFFGISRREALGMDPQQRLLLEVCWEAIENAGIAPARLRGTAAGVFMGIGTFDYAALRYAQLDYEGIDPYFATGGVLSVAAGRLSYVLGLTGPSMAVDTACSSSLVAVHLACQSLRSRECDLALAGGVNVILLPELSINFSKARMLSPDGRCKTFDASADGYVRGEGCGVVVLKRLSDALAAGDRIRALIRGSAVNQDGPSGGLTVPSGPAQEEVIRRALLNGGVKAEEVGYIEAHGTGTSLGDPIEVGSLGKVFGGRSRKDPLVIGSVKTNIGHLEAAAGIAGLIKAVLSLERGEIPPHLHFRRPNPHIAWEKLPFEIPTEPQKWPKGKKRLAGVSAFGASGTNAHVVLEEGPVCGKRASGCERPVHLMALSAKSETALRELAGLYAAHLTDHPEEAIADVCYTANTGRSPFEERLAVVGAAGEEIAAGLRAYGEGCAGAGVGKGREGAKKIAFLFTGQGSQYAGMGRGLYATSPAFRAVLENCAEILKCRLPRPLLEVIYGSGGGPGNGSDLDDTACTQPALFAVEMALFELWKGWGIEPSLVMGHSVGEYAAACAAGVFSLEDGLRLVAERGRLMGRISVAGGMAAVLAEESRVREAIGLYGGVTVSAINGPQSVVISGPGAEVDAAVEGLARQGIAVRRLKVSQAFHSALVEEVLPAFKEAAAGVAYERPRIGIVSNLTGGLLTDEMARPEYWVRHSREPVRFQAGMETLREEGCGIFLEVGPNPVLLGMGRRCLPEGYGSWLPSLREGQEDWRRMLTSLGDLYSEGVTPDWQGFDRDYGRNRVVLPTYPFQRQRYWIGGLGTKRAVSGGMAGVHPLLGRRLPTAHKDVIFETRVAPDSPPFLTDHRIYGSVVFPATGYVEMALAGGSELLGSEALTIEGFSIHQPLILSGEGSVVQTILHPEAEGCYAFEIFSEASPGQWRLHATGRIRGGGEEGGRAESLEALKARCTEPLSVGAHYRGFGEKGIAYGPAFRGIEELTRGEGECLGFLRASGIVEDDLSSYRLHPGLFDAGLQAAAAILPAGSGQENRLPVGMRRLRIASRPAPVFWSHARLRGAGDPDRNCELDFCLYDETGRAFVQVEGFSVKSATREALFAGVEGEGEAKLYAVRWEPVALPGEKDEGGVSGRWVIFADEGGLGEKTAGALKAEGAGTALVYRGERYAREGDGRYRVNPLEPEDFRCLQEDVFAGGGCRGVVHLWSLDSGGKTDRSSIEQGKVLGCGSVLHLIQSLSRVGFQPRVWLVTRGAQAAGDLTQRVSVHQSPLWGFQRVIALEHPELRSVCIDLDSGQDVEEGRRLLAELCRPEGSDGEDRIAYRGGVRYGARLVRAGQRGAGREEVPRRMGIKEYGIIENLILGPMERRRPGKGEVEIEVWATGLNFRDVLRALGMLKAYEPHLEDASDARFGFECSGRITAVGEGVEGLGVGDEVIAGLTVEGSLASHVTTAAAGVVRRPVGMSHEEGATIPLAFLTACYGLERLAKIRKGERVLIHAAAGGVGLAAVQLAQRAGARVYATASPGKWEYLNALGVEEVMNSRTLGYAEEIKTLTGGKGVDVILNSLTGEYISKNLEILAEGGRFIEIGKIGIWDGERVRQRRPDIRYHPFDFGEVAREDPGLLREMLAGLMGGFARGELQPLKRTVFGIEEGAKAFRYMAQARHTGKVVLTRQGGRVRIRPDATYLITGGLGALGLLIAKRLKNRGAKNIVLCGRGSARPGSADTIERLKGDGTNIVVMQGDVSIEEEMKGILGRIKETMPELKGIVHAAGILDDGIIREQTWERFAKVMSPKIDGAWNLHCHSQDRQLDFFILFSSTASGLGSPGQCNYAAANAFLDALSYDLRRNGCRATTINWGPWDGIGMAASHKDLSARYSRQGVRPIRPADGLGLFDRILASDLVQAYAADIDWDLYASRVSARRDSGFLVHLLKGAAASEGEVRKKSAIKWKLAEAAADERGGILRSSVIDAARRVMGHGDAGQIRTDRPLMEQGVDSLMSVELRNLLSEGLDLPLPVGLLFNYPSVNDLCRYLAELLKIGSPDAVPDRKGAAPGKGDDEFAYIDALDAEELEALVLKEIP